MKRTAILLLVVVVLAWVGSKMVPRSEPALAAVPASSQAVKASQSQTPLTAVEKKAQQEKWFGAETIVAAQRAVRASLKDPDSAKFKDVYANYTEEFQVVACGQINSKNSLGGYTGFKRFVSNGRTAIIEGRDNITDAWKGACQ